MSIKLDNKKESYEVFKDYRKCKIYCFGCGSNEMRIHHQDVHLEFSPILNQYVPHTTCLRCKNGSARVVMVIKETPEKIPMTDRLRMTKDELKRKREQDLKLYENKYGSEAVVKDFLQPFAVDGSPNEKFVKAYTNDKQILKNTYTAKALRGIGARDLADEKDKENNTDSSKSIIIAKR